MSPATLRRYRAEKLLARDFEALRAGVLATVGARLRAIGPGLDPAELDACYASAWQGLYAAALAGESIANPRGWLVLVTYRRAIEELRLRRRREEPLTDNERVEPDIDAELDDRERLRRLLEGLRARLDLREREAAALCYLHGYSRSEAARRMGLSDARMRKLMEGSNGRAGVSAKVGEVVELIRSGSYCEHQASLMRAFAYGVLDPEGERYSLALAHRRSCPACRRYVAVLRGAAAVLPPVLTLPGGARAGIAGLAALGHHAPAQASAPVLGASAAGGGGASAGGGWALGGIGAKLAAGCLIAAGIGAGCIAVTGVHDHRRAHPARGRRTSPGVLRSASEPALPTASARPRAERTAAAPEGSAPRRLPARGPAPAANREFSLEQGAATAPGGLARAAAARPAPRARALAGPESGGAAAAGEREFSPG